ncbi:hypothetical protein [Fusobacterium sp. MFO224]|uniref:hypothetical protein n=1 Tax=Fusobacterium sp. MFO224 TaxID=3378070 RepID=UPI003854B687
MELTLYEKIEFEIKRKYKTKTKYAEKIGIRKQRLNYILNRIKSNEINIKELKKIVNSLELELAIVIKRKG